MDRDKAEIQLTEADSVLQKVVGRTVLGFGLDQEGLHLHLNDGQTPIFMGVLCLMPSENGSH